MRKRLSLKSPVPALLIIAAGLVLPLTEVQGWGPYGHELSGRTAALKMPKEMPKFFRQSVDQLAHLNPEPDRWRDRTESDLDKCMDTAMAPEHFLDMELVPKPAFEAVNRYDFAAELIKAGQKPTTAGFLPYRIMELFQTLRVEFRLWRAENDPAKRKWIEQRIINDAGILGHYVSDGANPHHTTIHFNGWSGDNPKNYTINTRERGIHFRFESEYVSAQIKLNEVLPLVSPQPRLLENPREEIWKYLRASNSLVEQVYILDQQEAFNAANTSGPHKTFVKERLAVG
ncbi:MAG TPA: hypothetical protein VJ302_29710, partial [Blastocatellia bacterium]|nr:hypothetical protein [Blastocatellia bacterium]